MQPKTPNVYVQEKSIFPPSVAEVATAIPAFIGRTAIAKDGADESLVNQPIRITSMVEYERWFGGSYKESFSHFKAKGIKKTDGYESIYDLELDLSAPKPDPVARFILYHCVAHFFANGGGACFVVSTGVYAGDTVTSNGTTTTSFPLPGEEKAQFVTALAAIDKVDEVTLLVLSDAAARMSTVDSSKNQDDRVSYYGICQQAIAQCVERKDRFTLIDTIDSVLPDTDMNDDFASVRNNTPAEVGQTKYAATYYPYLRTSNSRSYGESSVSITVMEYKKTTDADGNVTSIDAVMDSADATKQVSEVITMNHADLVGTAAYANLKGLLASQNMILPPCPAIAGIYARVDASRGVWKAPANVSVSGVVGPVRIIDNASQESMNVDTVAGKSINAIRAFTGKGTLVWGARTLAGNDNEWRYVPVRRLFNMVEESVQKATNFAVFEPNTPFTWLKLKTMIESYLESLWKQGALFGETKEVAYFVNVGLGQTMTEADINNGIMNIEIGLAAVRPAEFIILTFSHKSIEG